MTRREESQNLLRRRRARIKRVSQRFTLCLDKFIVNQLTFQLLALQAEDALRRGVMDTNLRTSISIDLKTIVRCC